jgi:hypothetical protein
MIDRGSQSVAETGCYCFPFIENQLFISLFQVTGMNF